MKRKGRKVLKDRSAEVVELEFTRHIDGVYVPEVMAYRAMQVMVLDQNNRGYLELNDPKALEQLQEAIAAVSVMPEVKKYRNLEFEETTLTLTEVTNLIQRRITETFSPVLASYGLSSEARYSRSMSAMDWVNLFNTGFAYTNELLVYRDKQFILRTKK